MAVRVLGARLLNAGHARVELLLGVADQYRQTAACVPVHQPPAVQAVGVLQCRDYFVLDVLDSGGEISPGLAVERHHNCEHHIPPPGSGISYPARLPEGLAVQVKSMTSVNHSTREGWAALASASAGPSWECMNFS